jgi:molybdopterin-containing oxidoreductase family iron-sulfur binding subunit
MSEATEHGLKRREFLKILGTASAAGAAVGCSSEKFEHLIPYLVSPDNTVPGVSTYYATTCRECAAACGIIAETRDGRAIKLEGNPTHPLNRGALCARGQAALQGLYNPDRFRGPMARRGTELVRITWDDALKQFGQMLAEVRGQNKAGAAVFVNQHESGSFPGFLDGWLASFGMPAHLSVDDGVDSAAVAANLQAYGVAWPRLDFGSAKVIISFGADFLDTWGASVPQQLDFADARAKLAAAPRFIYVGSRRSLTGLNADEWIDCRPSTEVAIAQALLAAMSGAPGAVEQAATQSGVAADRLQRVIREVVAAKPSLAVAGGHYTGGADLLRAVAEFNRVAGNVGVTVRPAESIQSFEGLADALLVSDAMRRMRDGQVPLVMFRGVNPAFTLPPGAGFADAMGKVPHKVSFSSYPDETTMMCDLVLPDHHALEQWGDAQPVRGTVSLQQPAMAPVFDSRATSDVLIAVAKADTALAPRYPVADYRAWLISRFPGGARSFADALQTSVVQGVLQGATAQRRPAARAAAVATAPGASAQLAGEFQFIVYPSPALGEGRGANKPWLQELPDPVTKMCWQSAVELHPEAAKRLGIENGDHVTVRTAAGSITAVAYLYLGIQRDTIAMSLGRGHTAYGRYAQNIGVNPLAALPSTVDAASGVLVRGPVRASLTKGDGHSLLVTTEGSARQHGRGIARAMTVADLAQPAAAETHEFVGDASHEFLPGLRAPVANDAEGALGGTNSTQKGMYRPDHYSKMSERRWAMAIDLARCTGCSACVTACYAENNIPTVGAPWQGPVLFPDRTGPGANITRGREMAWIRLERYFEGGEHGEADFDTRFIPMMCQQCGNAPCEPVCPVYATYHAPDGLNVQVYNRCVGTRYCSNNCPYKVRYFNWFGYGEPARQQYAFPEPLNWQLNPDVTVRGKGVMEKCTFCVQRIRESEHRARAEGRAVAPDEMTTACAEACPSRAIVFGDAADDAWTVNTLIRDRRAYHVFEELNTFTGVVYLKKVTHAAAGAAAGATAPGGGGDGDE